MKLPELLSVLAVSAEQHPSKGAIVADGEEWTYRQFWELVSKTNAELSALELPSDTAIAAVTAHKSSATLALMLALGQQGLTPLAFSPGLGHSIKPAMFKNAGVYCELSVALEGGAPTLRCRLLQTFKRELLLMHTPL